MANLLQERQQAHSLLDRLPPDQLAAVLGLLETMLDPIDRNLALAPIDDEPETEKERSTVAEVIESLQAKWRRSDGSHTNGRISPTWPTMTRLKSIRPDGEEYHLV